MRTQTSLLIGLLAASTIGCAGAPAKPFDTMKDANVIAFRLQNYEPPAAATATAGPTTGVIPGLPPEITQWAQQALPGLQQFLPPGLLPPGMLQGMAQTPAAATAQQIPRFPMSQPNFPILNQTQVIDPDLREALGKVLGDDSNFQPEHANCMYAEMGLSFIPVSGGQPNDLLISFSCNQVQARSFAWPHANNGLKPQTVKDLAALTQKIWPSG